MSLAVTYRRVIYAHCNVEDTTAILDFDDYDMVRLQYDVVVWSRNSRAPSRAQDSLALPPRSLGDAVVHG